MLIGYNTNGFAHHRLPDAIEILADLGYEALALTPDVHHLDPFTASPADVRRIRDQLARHSMTAVIETGARFVLDPRRKHRPVLLEPDPRGREVRVDFLLRCVRLAAQLEASVVSIWSGQRPEGVSEEQAWGFLLAGIESLLREAERAAVKIGFEPEPGMWIDDLAGWERLRERLSHPALGLTLDTGHVPCTESVPAHEAIRRHRADLVNVHLDDSRGGVHQHLQLGQGELDWPQIVDALRSYPGVASVELSRHSHQAPTAAAESIDFLRRVGFTAPER